jgi:hypothetical protein
MWATQLGRQKDLYLVLLMENYSENGLALMMEMNWEQSLAAMKG